MCFNSKKWCCVSVIIYFTLAVVFAILLSVFVTRSKMTGNNLHYSTYGRHILFRVEVHDIDLVRIVVLNDKQYDEFSICNSSIIPRDPIDTLSVIKFKNICIVEISVDGLMKSSKIQGELDITNVYTLCNDVCNEINYNKFVVEFQNIQNKIKNIYGADKIVFIVASVLMSIMTILMFIGIYAICTWDNDMGGGRVA